MQDQLTKLAIYRCNKVIEATQDDHMFDSDFIDSILRQIEDGRQITARQFESVSNVYNYWVED